MASVSNKLIPGVYEFGLTVWDTRGANSSATMKVTVIQSRNTPPVAVTGGDRTVRLPVSEVVLNGSSSYDDIRIVSYLWERTPESLAFGSIIGNSSHSPLLRLTDLIVGRYLFRLTVTDSQGSQSSQVVSLIVKTPEDLSDEIELVLNTDVKSFTTSQESTLKKRLELLLTSDGQPVRVESVKLDATTHTRR